MTSLTYLGFVKKTHGYKGEILITLDADNHTFTKKKPLFLEIAGKGVPFFMESLKDSGSELLVKFEYINSFEEAKEIIGLRVYSEKSGRSESETAYTEIEGYDIVDKDLGNIGKVKGILYKPGQNLIEAVFENKNYFIPMVAEFILKVDTKKNILHTHLPEGLMDANEP
ncbi:MAG: 16S rRNA processing protein RimM [Flavobacteriales bacterium]|nr:16S rRNA processing protein RimM [Flavobacteriales bacterium]